MTGLQTSVLMKTDMSGSTARIRGLSESDLNVLFAEHHALVARIVTPKGGVIVKSEGDGFWLVFPSVTAASLAALAMQDELRLAQPGKGDDRVAMRIVIVLGDILVQEGAVVGEAVVLAARIEAVTPPDEIYLSPAAWLAVNKAEVKTSVVDAFALKGFETPVLLYRVDPTHQTLVFTDQYIVVTDVKGFEAFSDSHPMTAVEGILDYLLQLVEEACREFRGTHRFAAGDAHCLTFLTAEEAVAAVERLYKAWRSFQQGEGYRCPINIVVHKGTLYAYRSYLYGHDVTLAFNAETATHRGFVFGDHIFLTEPVRLELHGTSWDARLQPVALPETPSRLKGIAIFELIFELV